jgi:hypothetical protein
VLAVDTETKGLAYHEGVESVFMVQWADAFGEHLATERTGWAEFHAALDRERLGQRLVVFANASFDLHHLRCSGIVDLIEEPEGLRVHDVQTLARVCIPGRFGYKLEQLGTDILGADSTVAQHELKAAATLSAYSQRIACLALFPWLPARLIKPFRGVSWTTENKDYYALWRLEPELMEKYGKEDVRLTYDLFDRIFTRALKSDIEVYKFEANEVAPLLRVAEHDGVLKDMERVAALKMRLLNERDELREECLSGGLSEQALGELQPIDPEDPDAEPTYGKASSAALLEDLLAIGVPLYKLTKSSGKPKKNSKAADGYKRDPATGEVVLNPDRLAVDKDALNEFVDSHPVVKSLMEWRNRNLTLRTYIGALEQPGARVHTSFNQVQARTSRMSSSRPNMQNLPTTEGVRDVLVPAPGNCLLVGDYDSIEVRVLAHNIGNPELIERIEAGFDLYTMNAAGAEMGDAVEYYDMFLKGGPNDKVRSKYKITTLTAMYGGGARLIGVRLGIPTMDAAALKQKCLDQIPGYARFDERCKAAVRKRSFPHIRTLLGRRLYVPRDKPYVTLNTKIQGDAAELMKLGVVAACPAVAPMGYRLRLVVHDECVFEGPTPYADDAKAAMIGAMEGAYDLRPALKVSADWSTDSYGKAK